MAAAAMSQDNHLVEGGHYSHVVAEENAHTGVGEERGPWAHLSHPSGTGYGAAEDAASAAAAGEADDAPQCGAVAADTASDDNEKAGGESDDTDEPA